MRLYLYHIGKPRDRHANAMAQEYLKRLGRYARCEMSEIKPERVDPWAKYPAATMLKSRTGGSCLVYLPENTAAFYHFFEPDLPTKSCDPDAELLQDHRVTVALSPYAFPDQVKQVFGRLQKSGLERVEGKAVGGMVILEYAGDATSNTGGHEAR